MQERDTGESRPNPGQGNHAILDRFRMGRKQIRDVAVMLLALGLGSALTIYFTAEPTPADPLGYDPMDTKKYLRELEVYGGQANVLSVEFREWFSGLWHGKTLAATVAVLTIFLTFAFWFVASNQVSDDGGQAGPGTKPEVTP